MVNSVTHICSHEWQSGALRFDTMGALYGCLVCDACGTIVSELPTQTAEARRLAPHLSLAPAVAA